MVHFIQPHHWTTSMDISVQIKSVYGRDLVYPVCKRAMAFATIANTDTLTQQTIDQIKLLGYRIMVIPITRVL